MDVNPYEAPHEPQRQDSGKPPQPTPYPHWLIVIDIAMILVVLAVIAVALLPAMSAATRN